MPRTRGGPTLPMSIPAKSKWIAIAAALAMGAAGGLVLALRPSAPPLRIGINAWPGYEHIYLAKAAGFFEKEGVEVEILEFNSLLDARRAFERGQIDGFGTTATDVALTLGQTSAEPRIVQVVDYSNGGDLVVADTAIKKLAELRGKRVGLETGSVSSYVLARALALGGILGPEITTISSDQTSLVEDLHSGKLDAIVTYPPFSLKALATGGTSAIFTTKSIPKEVVDVIAFDEAVISKRPEDVRKVLRAYWRARHAAQTQPHEYIPVMAKREGITDSEFVASLKEDIRLLDQADQASFFGKDGQLRTILARTDSVLRSQGLVRGKPSPAPAMMDPLALENATSPR